MKISNKGLSLIEMLVSIMIMGILSGIAVVSYSGQKERMTHNDLKLHSELFASAVKTCILTSGWTTELPGGTKTTGCKQFKPCTIEKNCQSNNLNELKKKIGFTCPKDTDCKVYTNSNTSNPGFYYHCLYMNTKKPVGGDHIQYITRVRIKDPNQYQIWKSKKKPDFTTPEIPRDPTCKGGKRFQGGDIRTTHERIHPPPPPTP